jgi:hypothetical protein
LLSSIGRSGCLLSLALAVVGTGQAIASEKIFLSCEGFYHQGTNEKTDTGQTGKHSFSVDPDQNRVNSSIGNFRITKIDEREIKFEGPYKGTPPGTHTGRIDRVTGEAVTWITDAGQQKPWITFIFTCSAVAPKF